MAVYVIHLKESGSHKSHANIIYNHPKESCCVSQTAVQTPYINGIHLKGVSHNYRSAASKSKDSTVAKLKSCLTFRLSRLI